MPPLLRAGVPAPEKLGPPDHLLSHSGVATAVQADVRGEKAPDDALARELGAMGLL